MIRHTNPSGYVYYDNEAELCKELELHFFPIFFDTPWVPTEGTTKEVYITETDRIDYYGYTKKKPTYVEVKNWFVTAKDMIQILRYNRYAEGKIVVICGGIDNTRQFGLEQLGITTLLTKDIPEINSQEAIYWM